MGRAAQVQLATLRTCLVNLPLAIHAPLQERGIAPQSLVVELSYAGPTKGSLLKAYVGSSGLPAAVVPLSNQLVRSGKADPDRVEIDHQFAAMLGGLDQGMPVSIELLRDLPTATSVSVTPCSADDWEILETNAEFVEMNLLSQVRAVREGMVIGCWIGGTTLVRFTVDATVPTASPALLLTSATELLVAPKTRNALVPSSPTKAHDISSSAASSKADLMVARGAEGSEWETVKRRLVRLLPGAYELPPTSSAAAFRVDADAVYLPMSLYKQLTRAFPQQRVTVTHFPRPVTRPISGPAPGSERESTHDVAPAGGAAGAAKDKADERERKPAVEVKILLAKSIASGNIWAGEGIRKQLGLVGIGEGGFELIKFGPPLSVAAKRARDSLALQAASSVTAPNGTGHQSLSRPAAFSKQVRSPVATSADLSPPPASPLIATKLAGVDDKLESIKSHVITSLTSRVLGGTGAASGILVTGASGAGKTALISQVARELAVDDRALTHVIQIDCSKLTDERLPTLKVKMKEWFDEACWFAPSILVLDNLDRLLSVEVEHADSFPTLHLTHTFLSTALPALASRPIILIATAISTASLHPLLSTTHLLGENVSLRGPGKSGRRDILASLVKTKAGSSNLEISKMINFAEIASMTEGYLPADLRDLVDRAIHQGAIRSAGSRAIGLTLTPADFTEAQVGFLPLSLREVKLQKSEVQWADIGGLHETRKVLRETLEWPTKYGAIFASCPLRLRSGLLLYGFPGCGKTLLASAVAKECGLNFISVKGPEILNKYIGASEKSVRDLFERAQAAKPCILFFDEFDSIAPKRGHDSTGVTDRVVNQMLTQMDGAEGLDGVYVLAATSRPDLIDPALLRPGRLDKSLLCDMPSHSDRLEIMLACSRKIALAPSVDLSLYATRTAGFSGADLQAFIYNAHLDAIHAGLSASMEGDVTTSGGAEEGREIVHVAFGGGTEGKVLSRAEQAGVTKRLELILNTVAAQTHGGSLSKQVVPASTPRPTTLVDESHLEKSLLSTRSSVPAEELVRLTKIYSEFVSGRSVAGLPSGESSDEVGARSSLM